MYLMFFFKLNERNTVRPDVESLIDCSQAVGFYFQTLHSLNFIRVVFYRHIVIIKHVNIYVMRITCVYGLDKTATDNNDYSVFHWMFFLTGLLRVTVPLRPDAFTKPAGNFNALVFVHFTSVKGTVVTITG